METESENATPPPKKKTKRSPAITDISLEKEVGTSQAPSPPLDPNIWICGVEKEGKNVVKGETLSPKDKVTLVGVETLENNVDFSNFNKDSSDSPIAMLQNTKTRVMEFYKHPEVEAKILAELHCVLHKRSTNREEWTFRFEEVKQMDYLHATLSESLRLYTPIVEEGKEAAKDDILLNGTQTEKGAQVRYSIYLCGRLDSV
ncbi:cytochrome P450 86B1-like [Cryptomeria japonica]|uniref:cytochrome P450 86B1-like n=1 Tax=Cryptomeria japonica TaxID=3369 RepID=UPI0027DA6E49|nr:cytochrome P450 86B1-like [Cryptomeria japonica]